MLVALVACTWSCVETMHVGEHDGDSGADAAPPIFAPVPDASAAEASATKMCIATACPAPYATCDYSADRCRTDLSNDVDNCGACGNECPTILYEPRGGVGVDVHHLVSRCAEGKCVVECNSNEWQDCNGLVDDGCETKVAGNPDHCGACGNKCAPDAPCIVTNTGQSQCGCTGGLTYCPSSGCVDLSNDDMNCRECDNQCPSRPEDASAPPPHSHYGCVGSTCQASVTHLKCDGGGSVRYADCNGDLSHPDGGGCETSIGNTPGSLSGDPDNCGACGNKCLPGQECTYVRNGSFGCVCTPGETLCKSYRGSWCADLLTDANDCGACGNACVRDGLKNTFGICRKGVCVDECAPGWGDCDGNANNGCETNLKTNIAHCGACGARCDTAAGQPCIDGACLMTECDGGTLPQ